MGGGRGRGEGEACTAGLHSSPFVSNLLETILGPFMSQRSLRYVCWVEEGELDHPVMADGWLSMEVLCFFHHSCRREDNDIHNCMVSVACWLFPHSTAWLTYWLYRTCMCVVVACFPAKPTGLKWLVAL